MTKLFVKKPYYIIVAIVIVLTIGFVSLSKMQTDLLPQLDMPYMAIITTEIGASPQKVENDITTVLESTLGTISGVENVTSSSANNYSVVMLEFDEDTDMEAALVRVSESIGSVELPEGCGTPNIMEISTDMLATLMTGVSYKGKDIKELTTFVDKELKPYLERQDGVASVSANGMIEDTIEIRLNEKKIDKINNKILETANKKLKDASKKLDKAKKEIKSGKSALISSEGALASKQKDTNKQLAEASTQLSKAQASKAAYEATLNSQKASKSALEAEKKAYKDADIEKNYETLDTAFKTFNENLGEMAKAADVKIPSSLADAVENEEDLIAFVSWAKTLGMEEQVKAFEYATLKQVHDIAKVRMPQIETELANLGIKIKVSETVLDQVDKAVSDLDGKQSEVTSAGFAASAGFGAGQAQIASAKQQLETAEKELDTAQEQLDESRKSIKENANIDQLLSLDTLSKLLGAQNFEMPAGYIDDKDDNQWLVEVGERFESKQELKDLVLTKIDKVGKIKVSDVADIVVVDNIGDVYSKINGEDAITLSVYKASTSNTSEVSEGVINALDELKKTEKGFDYSIMMNQGDYINMIIDSVLSSILLGSILAIIVLALFLKSIRPTAIVALSIPFSVLCAIIIMYFTGINLNIMSLAGLALGIGMLVDNSVVVMENIYRLRNRGIPAPKAAVQGTKQVAGPIVASTLTTISVFFPMVYISGMVSQLLLPFVFTISYALTASLIVALTVVPAMGSVLLKKKVVAKQRWFESMKDRYAKVLAFCLKRKVIPLGIAIILLALSIIKLIDMGIVLMDDMESNQVNVTLKMEKDIEDEEAYKTVDEVIEKILKVDGIEKVSATDASTGMASVAGMSMDVSDSSTFSFNIITDESIKTTKQFKKIMKEIEKKTKDIKCEEIDVSSSALGAMSSLAASGLSVTIYGNDQDKLIDISNDVMDMMKEIDGVENVSNGLDENSKVVRLTIDKDKAAEDGLTVAQIFQELASHITTEKTAMTLSIDNNDVDVNIVDNKDKVTYENIMKTKITSTKTDDEGKTKTKKYKLSRYAKKTEGYALDTINRENQVQYLSVTSETKEGKNTTVLSRELEKKLDKYKAPEGYSVEITGETVSVNDMVKQMVLAMLLGFVLIYLVMVAQFQSLMSPFIIIFTVPLAFTGGMIGLILFNQQLSAMALMGFMILMGTVVNNGIVYVDYTNQLRVKGVDKRTALIATGKTRMRPILMTAFTTILSMSVMVFSQDAGNAMQKGMAIVVCVGLIYSTFMTLFIVPVMYDILYRHAPKNIDTGDDFEEVPDEAEELLEKGLNV